MASDELKMAMLAQRDAVDETRLADFDALYDKHAVFIWRTLRSLGVAQEDAEDAAQEVFMTVFRKLSAFEGRSSLRTWLCGIAAGVARNHTRKRRRREVAGRSLWAPGSTSPVENTEALDLVSRCLAQLDESLRMVFVLAELEQLTAPEIAEALTINVNTVYSRLRVARAKFEATLRQLEGSQP